MYAKDNDGKPVVGTLMRIEEDPESRYRFEIWFDYTRQIMNTVSEGAMVAVPNFYLDPEDRKREWLSVLEISTLLPVHYAISQNPAGFPGFLIEAARSAGQDWIEQDSQSTDDTTKIRCIAIPTNIMIDDVGQWQPEEGLPMVGHQAFLLDTKMTEKLANLVIDAQKDNCIPAGQLIRDSEVNIFVKIEELMKTHFAIFGFTGAGKSNLLATLIASILRKSKEPIKFVLLDLMGEYSVLILDLLIEFPGSRLITLSETTLAQEVWTSIAIGKGFEQAGDLMARTSLYPKGLHAQRARFAQPFAILLKSGKVRLYQHVINLTVEEAVREANPWAARRGGGKPKQDISTIVGRVFRKYYKKDIALTPAIAKELLTMLESEADVGGSQSPGKYKDDFAKLDRILSEVAQSDKDQKPYAISRSEIINLLNDKSHALIIVQAHDPDELRSFSRQFGEAVYEERRRKGLIDPLVSFVFDEADEFIPQNPQGSYVDSCQIAMTLARRGRKFGLGIGIATQRVTYLDTSIMAQPHTYFISKLPRKSDRERVCEAFGISEEMFRQTFKFKKGNWLVVSHDATGLESVPLPIKTENTDERILAWLNSITTKR